MPVRMSIAVLALVLALPAAAGAAEPQEGRSVAEFARQSFCDALAEWSLRTGRQYAYPATLPELDVVAAEPGREVDLRGVLAALGWSMTDVGNVAVVARDGDAEKVAALRAALLESADDSERRSAAYALGRLTVPAAAAALVEGLADARAGVQFQCLEALWAMERDFEMRRLPGRVSLMKVAALEAAPLAAVAAAAAEDRPRRAWRYAVALLGRAEAPEVRELALAGLGDPEPRIPAIAARALQRTARPEDEKVLADFVRGAKAWAAQREAVLAIALLPDFGRILSVKDLATGADEELAGLACEALGLVGRSEAAGALAQALGTGGPERAALAADALGRLAGPEAERALLDALKANEPWRRAAAASGLGALPRPRPAAAVAALRSAAADKSPEVRAAAARSLAACGGAEGRAAVLELSRDPERSVRQAALRALRRSGGAAALARLHELADDPVRELAEEARQGLGWLGGVKEAEKLAAIARDPALGRDGADGAIVGLGLLHPPEAREVAVATLLELMKDPPNCPHAVGRAATQLADARLVPGLLLVMARSQRIDKKTPRSGAKLSVDCMDALGRIATREAAEALAGDWWEWENMTRYQVGRALRENLLRGAVHATLLGLTKSSGHRLTAAAFSLSNSRDPQAVGALVGLLGARRESIAAATALGTIADPAATDALLAAAEDPTHPGRFAAARALRMRDLAWQPRVREALVRLHGWRPDGTPPPVEEQQPGTWVLRRWARDFDDLTTSLLTYESAAAYDTRRGRVFQWGAHGRRYDSPQTGETWVYDAGANVWSELGLRERPPGTCMTREICYDGAVDRLVVRGASGGGHGWLWTREQSLRQSSPWTYDPAADRWIPMRAQPPAGFALSSIVKFDRRHGVVLGLGRTPGEVWLYDTHANQWTAAPAADAAPPEGFGAVAWDRDRGRMLFFGKPGLWAYDLAAGRWTELKPANAPKGGTPLVYDSVSGVALAFQPGRGGTTVQAYDAAADAWTALKAEGLQPDHTNWDAAFDEKHNVAVVCGGEITSSPGSPTCRETWTYRFGLPPKPRPTPLPPPGPAAAVATPEGVRLAWAPAGDARVAGYRVERLAGDRAWGAQPQVLTGKPVKEAAFTDRSPLPAGEAAVYLVRSVDAEGNASPEPAIARTRPPIPLGVVAIWNAEKLARVTWEKSPAADVAGYNVYRAPVTAGELYGTKPLEGLGEFEKITAEFVKAAEFVDPEPATPGERGWAFAPRAYVVRAVNSLGVESGPSPWAPTLPDCPKRIEARRREDGSAVVRWEKDPNPDVVGYVVYRMDNWRNELATRVNETPVTGTTLIDPNGRPSGERQRYWVVAVDRFGQEGPSGTGAWSFNR